MRNAAKGLLLSIHQWYPRQFVVLEDALAANGPHIQTLIGYDMDFIINIKPVGNASLFETMHARFLLGEVTEEDENGKGTLDMSWITSLEITRENIFDLVRAARTRWKVENETSNRLKNQGYNYEHIYGHGKQHLSSTLAGLMLLAFLTDQIQQHACQLYKTVRKTLRVQKKMRESMRTVIQLVDIPDWETLWRILGKSKSEKALLRFIDTS